MKRTKQLLGATSAIALVALSTSPALAAGTSAGDIIRNDVSVSFDVGGVAQTAVIDNDEFTVDRKINVTVTVDEETVSVNPGRENAVLAFEITNLSNDVVDYQLSAVADAANPAGLSNIRIYLDLDNDGELDANELTAGTISYLDDMGEDEVRQVLVVADIGLGALNTDEFDIILTADARVASGTAASPGAAFENTAGGNTAGVDNVLADGAGDSDSAEQGDFSDRGTFIVAGAELTVEKTSSIVSDPINGTTNPKAIPGAVIEYCIVVSNAAGGATATDVAVNDDLPADVSYDAGYGIFVDGNASCATGSRGDNIATPTATYNEIDNEIDATLSDIGSSVSRSVYFRVTID